MEHGYRFEVGRGAFVRQQGFVSLGNAPSEAQELTAPFIRADQRFDGLMIASTSPPSGPTKARASFRAASSTVTSACLSSIGAPPLSPSLPPPA